MQQTIKILILIIVLVFSMTTKQAAAWPCFSSDEEFESQFKKSPFVFKGIAGEETENGTPIEITHIYKSPWNDAHTTTKALVNKRVTDYPRQPKFKVGKEYLMLSGSAYKNETYYYAEVSACSQDLSVEEKKKLYVQEGWNGPSFIGRANKILTSHVKNAHDKNTSLTIINFTVLKVLKESGKHSKLEINQSLNVEMPMCRAFTSLPYPFMAKLNHNYAVYTYLKSEPALRPIETQEDKNKNPDRTDLLSNCDRILHEDEDLELDELSKKNK